MKRKAFPLYQKILDDMISAINRGVWKVGERLSSEKELAEQYKVSRITSKKALDMLSGMGYIDRMPGRGSFVSQREPDLRSFDPTESAPVPTKPSDPVIRRPLLIGLILTGFDMSFGTLLLSGIEKAASENNIYLIVRRSYNILEQENRCIDDLILLGVDGLLINPMNDEYFNPKIMQLVLNGFPMVFVDRRFKGLNASFVGTNNMLAAKKATDYLLENGHRHISFLSPAYFNTAIEERLDGFIKSHAAHGIPFNEELRCTNVKAPITGMDIAHNADHGSRTLQSILQEHKEISCLLAVEYSVALLAIEVVSALGLNIPKDMSVLCFDGPCACFHEGTLTHIRQNEIEMGATAVKLLLGKIRNESEPTENIYLDADLILGYSTRSLLQAP